MPDADVSRWTPLAVLAEYLWKQAGAPEASGSLITISTRDGQTTFGRV